MRAMSCPKCGAGFMSEPIGASLRCKHCDWYLIALAEWKTLPPFDQGYVLYMQGAWATSELAEQKNPYKEGTDEWREFCHGERRAMISAQDSEE